MHSRIAQVPGEAVINVKSVIMRLRVPSRPSRDTVVQEQGLHAAADGLTGCTEHHGIVLELAKNFLVAPPTPLALPQRKVSTSWTHSNLLSQTTVWILGYAREPVASHGRIRSSLSLFYNVSLYCSHMPQTERIKGAAGTAGLDALQLSSFASEVVLWSVLVKNSVMTTPPAMWKAIPKSAG